MTVTATAMPDAVVVVNGPEGELPEWDAIDWRTAEDDVRRLRQRIFTASKAGDLKRVRNLQKLMLRSRANTLLSVRRVTERNAGRKTAGVDGKVVAARRQRPNGRPEQKHRTVDTHLVKRVYIPKRGSTGKRRPLGIPVIVDSVPSGPGSSTRWNPSGKHGSNRNLMGSGRAVAATTRSRPFSTSPGAPTPSGCGS